MLRSSPLSLPSTIGRSVPFRHGLLRDVELSPSNERLAERCRQQLVCLGLANPDFAPAWD
jgi:hypothetical protein